MSVSEEWLYVWLKRHVRAAGGELLGGQPPSGTDHLPVIEIKDPLSLDRGSKSAFKPDLVFLLGKTLFIAEIKPRYSAADQEKQSGLLASEGRIQRFWEEVDQRELRSQEIGKVSDARGYLELAAALAFEGVAPPDPNLWLLCSDRGTFTFLPPTTREVS
ncbi:MAG: hypothetical protein K9G08_03415 [Pontimonas sp.]|nr:hypothetical protein [Pontimonas sp.]